MPIVPPNWWEYNTAGRLVPSWPPPAPQPADGDDYTYSKPLIPRQWVPVAEHDEVLARLAKLEREVAELWSIIIESGREDKRTP